MKEKSVLVLAADIGGTSGRFALFEAGRELVLTDQVVLETAAHRDFESLAGTALTALGSPGPSLRAAVLAVAGPVDNDRYCHPPNIAYDFDLNGLTPGLLPPDCLLINDFAAQAHGCRIFGDGRSQAVTPGDMNPELTQAVVGPGTGLGKAALVPDGRGGYVVCGSEGGHAAFPFSGEPERDFHDFALEVLDEPYVRWESVVSGSGLALVHRYLTGEDLSPAEASAKLNPQSPVSALFARFLGRACRDYVLEVLARGGLYVSGGVAAKNPMLLEHPAFHEEFILSATHAELLARIPARLVTDHLTGLWGAAALAWAMTGIQESQ